MINEGLKENHTLLGLHFTGNPMDTDPLGFLKPANMDPAASHLMSRMGANLGEGTLSNQRVMLQSGSNCWI